MDKGRVGKSKTVRSQEGSERGGGGSRRIDYREEIKRGWRKRLKGEKGRKKGRKARRKEGRGKERKKKRASLRNWRQRKEEATGA